MSNLRSLLVTSEVTYVPRNYETALETILERAGEHVAGLVLLRNAGGRLLRRALQLRLLGCRRLAATLCTNVLGLRHARRQRLCAGRPVLRLRSMNGPEGVRWVHDNDIDLIVNLRTRCIYNEAILAAPRLGCVNVHHGLLPRYRGTFCDLRALASGRPAGFSIHVMETRLDAGPILASRSVSNGTERDYLRHLERSARLEGEQVAALLQATARLGRLPQSRPNDDPQPDWARTPGRDEIRALVRGGMRL
jgi:hypothetical protein